MADEGDRPLSDRLRDALAAVPAGKTGRGPSLLREQVRAVFDRLTADRKRGAAWDALAVPFAALGVTTADGKPPTGADLRNAYHAERYARGGRRKRRQIQPKPPAPASVPTSRQHDVPEFETKIEPDLAPPPEPASTEAPATPAADKLRASLARRRSDLSEPKPINLGPDDRRPRKEDKDA